MSIPEPQRHAIAVDAVSKQFVDVRGVVTPVLRDISFSVAVGEVVCVIGPSGTGKTTLMRILAGLDEASSGSVEFEVNGTGTPIISYMQQGDSLLPWRTVSANVRLGLEILARDSVHSDAAERLIERVGLGDARLRFPSQISGGMRRRAILARTLSVGADVLLLDEPLVHLDFLARRELADFARSEIVACGAPVVLVTHSIQEAVAMADRIVILHGRPATIVDRCDVLRTADSAHSAVPEFEAALYRRVKAIFKSRGV